MVALNDSETRQVLRSMLTENTGRSMLDSGDYYGRNYEFNQKINLDAQRSSEVRAYSRPRVFTLNSELSILYNARAELYPDPSGRMERNQLDMFTGRLVEDTAPSWSTDDGYHWSCDGSSRERLTDFPASEDADDRGNGVVYVDEDHNAYCPISGRKLIPSCS